MSADGKAQWLKLTVVQLKGALTMRGLEVDGKKAELVERLAEYEAKKEREKEEAEKKAAEEKEKGETEGEEKVVNGEEEKMETEEAKEETKEKEEEVDEDLFSLPRGKFVASYRSAAALLTVLITPFNDEFFSSASFNEHVKKVKTFKIHKIWNGTSGAELRFATVGESEDAFLALKNELASMEVDVYHPGFRTNFDQTTMRNNEFRTIFEGMGPDDASFERILIVDKLPEEMTDTKLAELIPEAIEIVNIGLYEESQGCMAVIFDSKKACSEWQENNKEFKVGDATVRCMTYYKKEKVGNVVRSKQRKVREEERRKAKEEGKGDESKKEEEVKLTDEDRLAKVKQWNALLNSRNVLQDRDDITGYEKLLEEKRITEEMTQLSKELLNDARQKVLAKEKLPEPEDQMTAPVRKLVQMSAAGNLKQSQKASGDDQKTPKSADYKASRPNQQRGRGGGPGGRGRGRGAYQQHPNQLQRRTQGWGPATGRGMDRRDGQPLRKRPSAGPIRPLGRGGSYYDDAPSKKRPRQQSPYRGGASMSMGGYGNAQEQQIHGLTSMLSNKMRELERMQQQTLAVQNQLSQNMRMAELGGGGGGGRSDGYSSGGGGGGGSLLGGQGSQGYGGGGYGTSTSQGGYGVGSSTYGGGSYGDSSVSSSTNYGMSSLSSSYGSGGSSYMAPSSSGSWGGGGYGGSQSGKGGGGSYGGKGGGGRSSYGGGQRRYSGGGGGGGGVKRNQNRRR